MYRHVCRILDNERQMRAELDAVLGQESRNLVVGVSYFRSSILIPRIKMCIRDRYNGTASEDGQ